MRKRRRAPPEAKYGAGRGFLPGPAPPFQSCEGALPSEPHPCPLVSAPLPFLWFPCSGFIRYMSVGIRAAGKRLAKDEGSARGSRFEGTTPPAAPASGPR